VIEIERDGAEAHREEEREIERLLNEEKG